MSKSDVARCFLKQRVRWDDGTTVKPIDLRFDSSGRQAFSKAIFGRPAKAIRAHWLQQVFSGKGVPPPEKSSDKAAVMAVLTNPGAIAYVSASTKVGKAKVVVITDLR